MMQKAVVVGFAVGAFAGAVGKSYFFKFRDRRKLHIEYEERKVDGNAIRKNCRFKKDPDITDLFSADNSDYLGSGWSRGHMAAAGNNKYLQESMNETFYLSNVLPQNLENNGGFWNRMEIFTRELTEKYKHVYVISGPIMMPRKEDTGKKYIRHDLIGKNDVAVPTHLFKIILVDDEIKAPAMAAFVVPNEPIPGERRLQEFQVPVDDIERRKGLTILPKLDRESARDLCEETECKLMPLEKFELYMIGRKLQSANTLYRLDVVWAELRKKKLKPDQYVIDLYWARKAEIEQVQNCQSKSGQE